MKVGLRWVEVHLNPPQPTSTHLNLNPPQPTSTHLNPPQPTSTHFNPLCSFYILFLCSFKSKYKKKSGFRWVGVDLNPPQPTSTHLNPPQPTSTHLNPPQPTSTHYIFSIFVFMCMSSQIQKKESGLRWVEVG